jgi:hypothetical protein
MSNESSKSVMIEFIMMYKDDPILELRRLIIITYDLLSLLIRFE